MKKDILKSADILDTVFQMEEDAKNGQPVDITAMCALIDEAANYCPHPTLMERPDLARPEAHVPMVYECYECGTHITVNE